MRPTRAFAVLGTGRAGALLLGGVAVAAWVASGQVTWMPSLGNLGLTAISIALALAACAFVPDPVYYDEDDWAEE